MLKWRFLFGLCWLIAAGLLFAHWKWGDQNYVSSNDIVEFAEKILGWFAAEVASHTNANPDHVKGFIVAKIGVLGFAVSIAALGIFLLIVTIRFIVSLRQPVTPAFVAIATLVVAKLTLTVLWIVFTKPMDKWYGYHAGWVKQVLAHYQRKDLELVFITVFKVHAMLVTAEAIVVAALLIGLARLYFGTWWSKRKRRKAAKAAATS